MDVEYLCIYCIYLYIYRYYILKLRIFSIEESRVVCGDESVTGVKELMYVSINKLNVKMMKNHSKSVDLNFTSCYFLTWCHLVSFEHWNVLNETRMYVYE